MPRAEELLVVAGDHFRPANSSDPSVEENLAARSSEPHQPAQRIRTNQHERLDSKGWS